MKQDWLIGIKSDKMLDSDWLIGNMIKPVKISFEFKYGEIIICNCNEIELDYCAETAERFGCYYKGGKIWKC